MAGRVVGSVALVGLYAAELALGDLGATRVKQYKVLMAAFPHSPAPLVKVADKPSEQNFVQTVFLCDLAQVFSIFKALGSGRPSRHFVIDFKHQTAVDAAPGELTFNELLIKH